MAQDLKYGKIDIPGIGDDEPVFVIRGRDECALDVLDAYAAIYEEHVESEDGPKQEIIDGVSSAQRTIGIWQTRNGTRLPA